MEACDRQVKGNKAIRGSTATRRAPLFPYFLVNFFPFTFFLVTLLVACTALPFDRLRTPPLDNGQPGDGSQPTAAVVLPQPTSAQSGALNPSKDDQGIEEKKSEIRQAELVQPKSEIQVVDVRITHVRDLSEILIQPGDQVQIGQPLARLDGYAEELDRDVQLIALELKQAQAKLAAAQQEATSEHERQMADAAAQVTTLERQVMKLQRRQQIADADLAEARATTAYRQRWLDVLVPLDEFDPWGDIPYLVGSQNGPKGPRSDLAYREAVAKAEYDLRRANLAQQIAELEAADVATQLQQAQADLEAAQASLEHLQVTSPAVDEQPAVTVYADSVRINELRLAQTRAELEKTVVKSLVAGQVLDIRIDRVDGNEATVIIRITTTRR